MDLYFLKFNSYYNRIIKFYSNLQEYQQNGEVLGDPLLGCSFNPNDSTDTTQLVNRKPEEIGDYMLAMLGNQIISRWFIMEARRLKTGQFLLNLRRDLFADSYTNVIQAPAFIEKATLNDDDPMIFNKEDMTFNQIKSGEHLLKDETESAWVVGYIPKDSFAEDKAIQGSVNIGEAYDIQVENLSNWDYWPYVNQKTNGHYNTSESLFGGYVYFKNLNQSVWAYMQGFALQLNGVIPSAKINTIVENNNSSGQNGVISGLTSPTTTQNNLVYSISSGTIEFDDAEAIVYNAPENWKRNISELVTLSLSYTGCLSAIEDYNFRQLGNKIIYETSSGLYHKINITKTKKTKTKDITAGNLFESLNTYLNRNVSSNGTITGTPSSSTFKMLYSYYEYTMTLEQVTVSANVTLNSDRYHLEDQPYDMFCIPYSDNLEIYKNGTKLFNANKSIAINMAIEIGADAGTNSIYDIQLLPYCPVRYCIKADGTFDIGNTKVHYIKNDNDENIGVILWAINSAFTLNIPYNLQIANPKIENQTDVYRLCSPNFNGQFEFSPAMNGGINYFNVDCNYRPFNPYIHINPNFNYLYGQDFNDARGLICGGDFSLPQISNAWANYQLTNKNYQNIFDRQIENMEVNNAIQRRKEIMGVSLGALGGLAGGAMAGAKAGPIGAAAGAVIGGIGSALVGGIDMALNESQRQEALDYTKDQFGYQLGNIQALPTSLSKTSALTYNNKIFPVLEFYTCTPEEKLALENKLKYNGMTVMRIGTIQEFMKETPTYIKGQLIRLEGTGEDFHYISELAKEFNKGVFI